MKLSRIIVSALASAALVAGAIGLATAPTANAATNRNGVCEAGEFCLYYAADEAQSVADFVVGNATGSVPDLASYTFVGTGLGKGTVVRNNAHSVWNNSTQPVTVYYSPNYAGTAQTIQPGQKGNLSAALVNNEASFKVGATPATGRNGTCQTGEFCLYYSANATESVSDFVVSNATGSVPDLASYTFLGAGLGKGTVVRNNAHSAWNNSSLPVTVFYGPNCTGTSQTFMPGTKGNLSTALINNEASFNDYTRPIKASFPAVTGGARYFGASRDGGSRAHAGIDFVVPNGTPVYAATNGTVQAYYLFYAGTYALEVKNTDGTVIRYGEITSTLRAGATVTRGQQIGTVKQNTTAARSSMLHLEYYKGNVSGSLTQATNRSYPNLSASEQTKNYKRRSDLLNPTFFASLPTS